jgi:hypothetical protein
MAATIAELSMIMRWQAVGPVTDDLVDRPGIPDGHVRDPIEELPQGGLAVDRTTRASRSSTARSIAVAVSSPVIRARRCASSSNFVDTDCRPEEAKFDAQDTIGRRPRLR